MESSAADGEVLESGHLCIFGSFFCRETKRWGYACCGGTAKGARCPLGVANRSAPKPRPTNVEGAAVDEKSPFPADPPAESAADGDYASKALLHCLHLWRSSASDRRQDQDLLR